MNTMCMNRIRETAVSASHSFDFYPEMSSGVAPECKSLEKEWMECIGGNWSKFIDAKLTEEDHCEERFDLFRGCYLYHMDEYLSGLKDTKKAEQDE